MSTIRKRDELANQLRADILSGKYGPEGGLPEESEIAKKSGYARGTVNSALTLLEGERIIEQRGRSYYVNKITIPMTQYVPPLHELVELNKKGFVRNLSSVRKGLAPEHLKILQPSTVVTLRERISGELINEIEEKPKQLLRYYYLIAITNEQIERMNANAGLDIWSEISPKNVHCHDILSARLPTSEEANLLKIPETTPVINVQTMITTTEKEYLLIQECVFVSTSFAYSYNYERPS